MKIETIERLHCQICGFITTNKRKIELARETGKCPACNNGKGVMWSIKRIDKYIINDKQSNGVKL